jgi:hypothetical protein
MTDARNKNRREHHNGLEMYFGKDGEFHTRHVADRVNKRRRAYYADNQERIRYMANDCAAIKRWPHTQAGQAQARSLQAVVTVPGAPWCAIPDGHGKWKPVFTKERDKAIRSSPEFLYRAKLKRREQRKDRAIAKREAEAIAKQLACERRKAREIAKREAVYAATRERNRIEMAQRMELNKRYEATLQEPGIGHNQGPALTERAA